MTMSDMYRIKTKDFVIKEILSYPEEDDVFYVLGEYKDKPVKAYIKIKGKAGSEPFYEKEIIEKLSETDFKYLPNVLGYGKEPVEFIIIEEAAGERLSDIVKENKNFESMEYMFEYGKELAKLHSLKADVPEVKHRQFFDIPKHEYFEKHGICFIEDFLKTHTPQKNECFVHGNFSSASVFWSNKKITKVFNYEFSGIGLKEFDMAWTCFLRPSQVFLKTAAEREKFLSGYASVLEFDRMSFDYYLVLIAAHFYDEGDEAYKREVERIMDISYSRWI